MASTSDAGRNTWKLKRPPPGLEQLDKSLDEIVKSSGRRYQQTPVGAAGTSSSTWGAQRPRQVGAAGTSSSTWGAQRPRQAQAAAPYVARRVKKSAWRDDGAERRRGYGASYKDCKVLPGSDVRQTAGYIAAAMRSGSTLTVKGESAEGLNQAVKSIALARSYLEDEGFDITVQFSDQTEDADADLVDIKVVPTADDWVREEIRSSQARELIVSSSSVPARVAGAIANSTREEQQVYCTAMGPQAVVRVAKSVFLARQYLAAEGVELCFVPQFAHTGDGLSAMHTYIFTIFKDCQVKDSADVKQTAGYIAAGVRSYAPPVVLADSAASINQAMKSLALTRSYLEEEGLDILIQPLFPDFYEDSSSSTMRLLLSVVDGSTREQLDLEASTELMVASESDPGKVAGAIASNVREGGSIHCTAMGPQAILRAVKSVFLARKYLEVDAIYPYLVPEFGKSAEGASLLNLHVLVQ